MVVYINCVLYKFYLYRYYSINVPLKEGMDDLSYEMVFCPVIEHVMNYYRSVGQLSVGLWVSSVVSGPLVGHWGMLRPSIMGRGVF